MNNNEMNNGLSARCAVFIGLFIFFIPMFDYSQNQRLLTDLFQAYFDARQHKRRKPDALAFELRFEENIMALFRDLIGRTYEISPGICFISFDPVQREIFAGNFRDRVVHHLLYNYLAPWWERQFISDTYSCRRGRGTLYGIRRAEHFMRACSRNYQRDCYVLKLDISGYFMAMNHDILFRKNLRLLERYREEMDFDQDLVRWLLHKVIFHDPTQICWRRGRRTDWDGLPRNKSLFRSAPRCGLPIGNLTSQLFGNVYLNDFDHFVQHKLKIKYYGRYVDDVLIWHESADYLRSILPAIDKFLARDVRLQINHKKTYLQHYAKGVRFLGAVIFPYRTYISNRIKGRLRARLRELQARRAQAATKQSCLASYLGLLGHFQTWNLRKWILGLLSS